MLPDDGSSLYEAPCPGGAPLMCFPSGKSVVTFLILLDWKNIANMVWSGKSFDAGALQINLRMPYGLHSSLNLFPINVHWILCGANMCVARLGKQKATESRLWQSVIIMISPFFPPSCLMDEIQSVSKTSKQENMQTVPLWALQFLPNTKKGPLKYNDCEIHDDSSADRLSPMKLSLGYHWQQASSGGGHGSELFQTQQTFLQRLPIRRRYDLLSVWVSAIKNTLFTPLLFSEPSTRKTKEQTCQTVN